MKIKHKFITIAFAIFFVFLLSSCSVGGFNGEYEGLRANWDYVFKNDSKDSGTFEIYEEGDLLGEENIRYSNSWTLKEDVLTLIRSEDKTYYFKIYDNAIIEISSPDTLPKYYEYIAPKGDSFNYKIDTYIFYEDGTIEDPYGKGQYFKDGNTIYCNIHVPDEEYFPLFYIYDTDHIADAADVCIKR